jgi:O-glycosyl hydrolase
MKKYLFLTILAAIILAFFACGTSDTASVEKLNRTINIKYNEGRQTIDGFGGSNAWTGLPRDQETARRLVKLLFSKTDGIGFTILRNRIPFRERLEDDTDPGLNDGFVVRKNDNTYDYTVNPNGTKTFNLNWNSWDLSGTRNLIEQIKALGANGPEKLTIMSAPWTVPNNRVTRWKEDITGVNARTNYVMNWSLPDRWGKLRRDKYDDYADLLADYVLNFEAKMGAPLSVLSVQNEPNWKSDWETTYWSGTDLRDFIVTISKRFPMKGVIAGNGGINIMMPEFENFNINFNEMIKPSLDNPASEKIITHIALHQYNGTNDSSSRAGSMEFPGITASGKRFWQTEVSGTGSALPPGPGINNALFYARMIHWDMTLAQTNAFLYWWLWTNNRNGDFPGALIKVDDDEIITSQRLYAMGQYSRFIRPGWQRIDCDTSPTSGIYSSAYKNPNTKEIAIVIINETITHFSLPLDLEGAEYDQLEIWRTSEKEKLKSIGKQQTSRNTTEVILAPMSITTFYGKVK